MKEKKLGYNNLNIVLVESENLLYLHSLNKYEYVYFKDR